MNLPLAILTIRWSVRDTFLQALSSGILWLMLSVSALCIIFCLSVGVNGAAELRHADGPSEFLPRKHPWDKSATPGANAGVDVVSGELTLAFGAMRLPLGRDAEDAVRFLQVLLAEGVAGAAGLLLALIWTAGFLPTFLEPGAAAVMFSKPVPRWWLLMGKYLGVLAFVGFQATVFVGGTWAALGLATGWWIPEYLLCIPALVLQFAIMYSASVLLATCTRSAMACVLGSVLFWFFCWGLNYGRHVVVTMSYLDAETSPLPSGFQTLVETVYWVLPKPADFNILFQRMLHASDFNSSIPVFETIQQINGFHAELSILSSCLFALALLIVAARELVMTDY